ncbi:hypothetical protein B5X24_HaOG209924 [Helicoverpa armigera]|uniref:AB hydrolase-1 domain-containing protein n=1 Tax=Helicoverpa armigera TaxID=29058 RepID=A0A2W1BD88_HELAM|nr:hypothetical protein B5X24_HaOG209924 [Helicoverpa armigera]
MVKKGFIEFHKTRLLTYTKKSPYGPKLMRFHFLMAMELAIAHLGWDHFIFIGHSMGCEQGLFFNAIHPNRITKMVLLDANPTLMRMQVEDPAEYQRAFFDNYYEHFHRENFERKTHTRVSAMRSLARARDLNDSQCADLLQRNFHTKSEAAQWHPIEKWHPNEAIAPRVMLILNDKDRITDIIKEFTKEEQRIAKLTGVKPNQADRGKRLTEYIGIADGVPLMAIAHLGHSMGCEQSLFFNAIHPNRITKMVLLDANPTLMRMQVEDPAEYQRAFFDNYYEHFHRENFERKTHTRVSAMRSLARARDLNDSQCADLLQRNFHTKSEAAQWHPIEKWHPNEAIAPRVMLILNDKDRITDIIKEFTKEEQRIAKLTGVKPNQADRGKRLTEYIRK